MEGEDTRIVNRADKDSVGCQLSFQFDCPTDMPTAQQARPNRDTGAAHVAADLFCGAGGLSLGFQNAGCQVAFGNDINEEYANTYRLNHDGTVFFRESIEDLTTSDVFKATGLNRRDVDILIGGPPCQGFSINAPKRPLGDDRNHNAEVRCYGR